MGSLQADWIVQERAILKPRPRKPAKNPARCGPLMVGQRRLPPLAGMESRHDKMTAVRRADAGPVFEILRRCAVLPGDARAGEAFGHVEPSVWPDLAATAEAHGLAPLV